MSLDLLRRSISLTESDQAYLEHRLDTAINRIRSQVQHIVVTLEDMNGPRGGIDKRCRIILFLHEAGVVTVEGQDSDLHRLIDQVCNRAGQAAHRKLGRWQQTRKSRSHQLDRRHQWGQKN